MPPILYEDKAFMVVNKAPGQHSDQIEVRRGAQNVEFKAVHRLDHETSGALMMASPEHWQTYHELFRDTGKMEKIYWAGLSTPYDNVDEKHPSYTFSGFIGSRYRSSKKSRVSFERAFRGYHSVRPISHIVKVFPQESLEEFKKVFTGYPVELQLLTGARHQIRAYFEFRNCPIVGDTVYNPTATESRLELHCHSLGFLDPLTQTRHHIVAPL
jgi:23S rRNA-/tRNA-specific pseudouridylate synthase